MKASGMLAELAGADGRATRVPRGTRASLGRTAIYLDLSVFVKRAFGAALRVKTDELRLVAFGIDELAFVGLEKFAIGAGTELRAVVLIVVEDNPRIFCKFSVIGDLDD